MRRYVTFDIERFLKDAKSGQWDKDIAKLKEDKEKILFLKAQGNSEVHSGNISHPTEDVAIKLAEIDNEISRIIQYPLCLNVSRGMLNPDEEELINGFYFNNKPINYFVDAYCIEHLCEKSTVYNRKIAAVEKLRRIIDDIIAEDSK